jgi:hypothetical protein
MNDDEDWHYYTDGKFMEAMDVYGAFRMENSSGKKDILEKLMQGTGTTLTGTDVAHAIMELLPSLHEIVEAGGVALEVGGMVGMGVSGAFAAFEMMTSFNSFIKTDNHLINLECIIKRYRGAEGVNPYTEPMLHYVIHKKKKKRLHKGIGMIPVVGSLSNTVYTIGRSIKKSGRKKVTNGDIEKAMKTKGWLRNVVAQILWLNQYNNCPMAIAACQELLGKKHGSFKRRVDPLGYIKLREKIKSL